MDKRKYTIYVNFYKQTGEWYASGPVEVSYLLFAMDRLKQDIVNNQDILTEGWQDDDFIVTISQISPYDTFFTHLFPQGAFANIRKNN